MASDNDVQPDSRSQIQPEPAEDPETGQGPRRIADGLWIVGLGVLAVLITFATVEALRLAMYVSGATGPLEAPLLRGIQQVGWQLMLTEYGVLLVGCGLLRSGIELGDHRWWAGAAVACIALALASRAAVIGVGPAMWMSEWWGVLLEVATAAEGWFLLGTLFAVDMVIRGLAAARGNESLRTFAGSHATLVVCLALAMLARLRLGDGDAGSLDARKAETLLRLAAGGICLAWTFRLVSDARSADETADVDS
jgi:hypothetical protein